MIVGFTGTRKGMTDGQVKYFASELSLLNATEFHHGDCIGADEQANKVARSMGIKTAGHPPIDSKNRAFCKCDMWFEPKPYLERNCDIVNACDVLFVAPRFNYEEQRSGTWSTFRFADKIGTKIIMVER